VIYQTEVFIQVDKALKEKVLFDSLCIGQVSRVVCYVGLANHATLVLHVRKYSMD